MTPRRSDRTDFRGERLLRVVLVGERPNGSDVRIQTAELYEDGVTLRWVAYPSSGRESAAGEETSFESWHDSPALELFDDEGNRYVLVGGQSGGAGELRRGHWDYTPAPPPTAAWLRVHGEGWSVTIDLARSE